MWIDRPVHDILDFSGAERPVPDLQFIYSIIAVEIWRVQISRGIGIFGRHEHCAIDVNSDGIAILTGESHMGPVAEGKCVINGSGIKIVVIGQVGHEMEGGVTLPHKIQGIVVIAEDTFTLVWHRCQLYPKGIGKTAGTTCNCGIS